MKEVLPVAARALGFTIQPWEVRTENDLDRAFAAMGKQRPDGIYLIGGNLINVNQKPGHGFRLKSRLPSTYYGGGTECGLMYYGADLVDIYRRSGILRGQNPEGDQPADLPVEQPTKFEFVINLKTAKQIGLTIPPEGARPSE